MIGFRRTPKTSAAGTRPRPGARTSVEPFFFAALENERLGSELQGILDGLLGQARVELLPEDGGIVLSRLRTALPSLVFLPMEMRQIEALTLLRALPPSRARQVVLIVPDTLEGLRVAWEALLLGARDILITRGSPAYRFKGSVGQRLRQLAHLLGAAAEGNASLPYEEEQRAVAGEEDKTLGAWHAEPWVALPETRALAATAGWLRNLPPEVPVVLRIPEGPRLLRAAREGLGRIAQWSVRSLVDGDRLVAGQIHLFGETEALRLEEEAGRPVVRLRPLSDAPASWSAYHSLMGDLRDSALALRILLPGPRDPELESFFARESAGRHTVYRLEQVSGTRVAV